MNFSTIYHLQIDEKIEIVNHVIEDMVWMLAMDRSFKWEDYLYLVEFAYNNGLHASLKMSPFEALYGRKWNTLIIWDNPTDRVTLGPAFLKEMEEQISKIKQNLKVAYDICVVKLWR